MHRDVGLPAEQGLLEFGSEQPFAALLGQRPFRLPIPRGDNFQQLTLRAGDHLAQTRRDHFSLRERQGAFASGENNFHVMSRRRDQVRPTVDRLGGHWSRHHRNKIGGR